MAKKRINQMNRTELEAVGKRMGLSGLGCMDFPQLRDHVRGSYAHAKHHPKYLKSTGLPKRGLL